MQVLPHTIRTEHRPAQTAQTAQSAKANSTSLSFSEVLGNTIEENSGRLQFSKHANLRLNARELALSSEQISRVEGGVKQAREKGIKDSLVLVDNVALVVNVRNKMVVTVMNQNDGQIFTNIDGAVIV